MVCRSGSQAIITLRNDVRDDEFTRVVTATQIGVNVQFAPHGAAILWPKVPIHLAVGDSTYTRI